MGSRGAATLILGSLTSRELWAGAAPSLRGSSSSALAFPCGGEKQEAAGLLEMMRSVKNPLIFLSLPVVLLIEGLGRAGPAALPSTAELAGLGHHFPTSPHPWEERAPLSSPSKGPLNRFG